MVSILETCQQALEETQCSFSSLYGSIVALKEEGGLEDHSVSLEEFVDIGWTIKETEEYLDDLRKRYKSLRELIEKIVCLRHIIANVNSTTKEQPVRGKLATGTPCTKEMHAVPKRKSPEHESLLRALGAKEGTESLFVIHWPTLVDYVDERDRKGLPVPKELTGVNKTFPVWKVYYRKKSEKLGENENG